MTMQTKALVDLRFLDRARMELSSTSVFKLLLTVYQLKNTVM